MADALAGRGNRELIVIYWRDIPAQVNAQEGRDRHQVVLGGKFQRAIDRAKRKARIYTADEDSRPVAPREPPASRGDLAAEAQAAADAIERRVRPRSPRPARLLRRLGGRRGDDARPSTQALAALEEL